MTTYYCFHYHYHLPPTTTTTTSSSSSSSSSCNHGFHICSSILCYLGRFAPFHLCHIMEKLPVTVFQISSANSRTPSFPVLVSTTTCTASSSMHCFLERRGRPAFDKISRYQWISSLKTLEARYWSCWFNQINQGGYFHFGSLDVLTYQNYPEILGPLMLDDSLPPIHCHWSIKQAIKPPWTSGSWSMRVPNIAASMVFLSCGDRCTWFFGILNLYHTQGQRHRAMFKVR